MEQRGMLPYEAYYINSGGVRINFDRPPFIMTSGGLFDTRWSLSMIQRSVYDGCRLISHRRLCDPIEINVEITAESRTMLAQYLSLLSDAFDYDVISGVSGQFFINGQYLRCWCGTSEKKLSCDFDTRATVTLTITPEVPVWYTEKRYHILPAQTYTGDGHKYPYSYPKRYGAGRRMVIAENTHFSPAPVRITFFGAADHPRLYLGSQCMGIDVLLAAGEYAVIDQRTREVYKVTSGGVRENCFDMRERSGSVFTYLPSGCNMLTLDSDGGADIILYEQRSEPLWALS